MEFLAPFNGILGRAPCGAACPTPPRFRSQVFSTSQQFPGKLEFHGLVSCRNRSWVPPFRAFPSQRALTPLEATCSLAVIHRSAGRPARDLSPPVSADSHARGAVAWLPPSAMSSLFTGRARFPVAPGLERRCRPCPRLHPPRSLVLPANPFASFRVAPTRRPLLSWVSSPPESPSRPRILDPPGLEARTRPLARRLGVATPGTSSPRRRVRSSPRPKAADRPRRRLPAPFGTGPHRLSAASPSPLAFSPPVARRT